MSERTNDKKLLNCLIFCEFTHIHARCPISFYKLFDKFMTEISIFNMYEG